jgi:hypothetical protein
MANHAITAIRSGEWRENGTTGGNRDPFSSPLASTERRKSRFTRTATRTVDE